MLLFIRPFLVLVQAASNHLAFLPPNKTPEKGRYHTEAPHVFQIAPLIFKLHSVLLWFIAVLEFIYVLAHHLRGTLVASSLPLDSICPTPRPYLLTPMFLTGVLFTVIGAFIRIRCFKELGSLFTFDLSILPDHKLVTSGCYSYVRHPAYTGSILIVIGVAISHLTAGSLLAECTLFGSMGSGLLLAVWWSWTLSVGISRALAEDKELQKLFGSEWDAYASSTKFWFIPGLY